MTRLLITLVVVLQVATSMAANRQQQWADSITSTLSLDQQIGQLIMIAGYSNRNTTYEQNLINTVNKYHIGGVVFFQGTVPRQIQITNRLQKDKKIPLFIGMDAEHGLGWRLTDAHAFPKMQILGAVDNQDIQFKLGAAIAKHLRAVGVHINFAPVVDINNNTNNPVIGIRSYGEDRQQVTSKAYAYARGSNSELVMPVIKHFPGHGDTDTDSHYAVPIVNKSRAAIDSIEFYPYRQLIPQGLPSVMVGHIAMPQLDPSGTPASQSKIITTDILRNEMNFQGLVFTDAMNMKGATIGNQPGEADIRALLAGVDIILFPENVVATVAKIKAAITKGDITPEEIKERCAKVLLYKKKYQADRFTPISYEKIKPRLSTTQDKKLEEDIYKNAITLIKNNDLIPLKGLDSLRIANVVVGGYGNTFTNRLSSYAKINNFSLTKSANTSQVATLKQRLQNYNTIIVYLGNGAIYPKGRFGYNPNLEPLLAPKAGQKIIVVYPGNPYGLKYYNLTHTSAVIVSYDKSTWAQDYAAQAIMGGIACKGVLPVSISREFPAKKGNQSLKTRLGYSSPEQHDICLQKFKELDSICELAIAKKATPGCQLLVAYKGDIIYNKSFGKQGYNSKETINNQSIYDIASITKITSTLPILMEMEDKDLVEIDGCLKQYLPSLTNTNKANIKLKDLLHHQAGLKAGIPLFAEAINRESCKGNLYSGRYSAHYSVKLKPQLYMTPNFTFKDSTLALSRHTGYDSVAPGLYVYPAFKDSLYKHVVESSVGARKYRYSDLSFFFLQEVVEQVNHKGLDQLADSLFFRKLGMYHTMYNPLNKLSYSNIVPSCLDKVYRKREIHGTVHDPLAAIQGGVAGHAGLFSTSEDLAKMMQLFLNGGVYGGEKYLSKAVIDRFTQEQALNNNNRRALGFDKPNFQNPRISSSSVLASKRSFGHTGFTGTIAWADPKDNVIFIFLSNRTYPNEFNNELIKQDIRTKLHDLVYEALPKS